MDCDLALFHEGTWHDCAFVRPLHPAQGGGSATLFEYDLDYVFGGIDEPVALEFPLNAAELRLSTWPAFLFDLIPQGAGRAYLLGELQLPNTPAADFALLCAGAFNPIGRTRVGQAVQYFARHVARHPDLKPEKGMTIDDIVLRSEEFKERMMIHGMLAAGTTGIQGAAPKYLLTRDGDGGWFGDGVLPDERAAAHFIVKLPRGKTEADRKVLRNEAAYMDVAAAMGLRTYGRLEHRDGMLFIPRFDRAVRTGKVSRFHQESAASVAGLIGFEARPSLFALLAALRRVLTRKEEDTIEFLKRDVLNLAMRNTDNHARNTAVQKIDDTVTLTPLFDFAPMYLDPEGIARVLRWYHPNTRVELTVWGDIIDALPVDGDERIRIRSAMSAFSEQMEGLTDRMAEAGVDTDIIEFLQQPIANQIRQLRDLRSRTLAGGG